MNSSLISVFATILLASPLAAQQPSKLKPTTAAEAPTRDTSFIDADGTARITRVIPVPNDLSPEAQRALSRAEPDQGPPLPLSERRRLTDLYTAGARIAWTKLCPNQVTETTIAGVPVHVVVPEGVLAANADRVLLNLHGGGFNSDSGSYTESIPIAWYTKTKVVSALYRLAPEHPFPAAVDDAIAVYKELLKTYTPAHIAIYGTSAGAILTGEVAARIKQLGLPQPAALGIFSGFGDATRLGDSMSMYALGGLKGHLDPPDPTHPDLEYMAKADPGDPVLSPLRGDLHGLPPTLFVTSGRDLLLSGTVNMHRAFLNAGIDARLVVYDALPHAFWYDSTLPEAIEANKLIADYLARAIGSTR